MGLKSLKRTAEVKWLVTCLLQLGTSELSVETKIDLGGRGGGG